MRLKDYQLYIPRYESETGYWLNATDMYERQQPGYIPRPGDWFCNLCQNVNFRWRRTCNNLMCKAPKGWRTKKAEKNSVTSFDGQIDPKKNDENVSEKPPDESQRAEKNDIKKDENMIEESPDDYLMGEEHMLIEAELFGVDYDSARRKRWTSYFEPGGKYYDPKKDENMTEESPDVDFDSAQRKRLDLVSLVMPGGKYGLTTYYG